MGFGFPLECGLIFLFEKTLKGKFLFFFYIRIPIDFLIGVEHIGKVHFYFFNLFNFFRIACLSVSLQFTEIFHGCILRGGFRHGNSLIVCYVGGQIDRLIQFHQAFLFRFIQIQ